MTTFRSFVYCATPDCDGGWKGLPVKDMPPEACSACTQLFCPYCKTASHAPRTCTEVEAMEEEGEDARLNRLAGFLPCPGCGILVFNSEGCDWLTCLNPSCRRQWNPFHDNMAAAHSEHYPAFILEAGREDSINTAADLRRFLSKHDLVARTLGIPRQVTLIERALAEYMAEPEREDLRDVLFLWLGQIPEVYAALKGYFTRLAARTPEEASFLEGIATCGSFEDLCVYVLDSENAVCSAADKTAIASLKDAFEAGTEPFVLVSRCRILECRELKDRVKRLLA